MKNQPKNMRVPYGLSVHGKEEIKADENDEDLYSLKNFSI